MAEQFVHLGRGIHIEQAQIPAGAKTHRVVPTQWSPANVREHLKNKALTGGNPPLYAWIDTDDTQRHPVTCVLPLVGTLHETLAAVSLRCLDSDDQDGHPEPPPVPTPPAPQDDTEPAPDTE